MMFTEFSSRDTARFSQVFKIFQATLIAFAAAIMLIGCGEDDNPIIDEHDEHAEEAPFHAEADGIVLKVDGTEVYRQFQGTQTGGISVSTGEEILVHVSFLSPTSSEFLPSEEDDPAHEGDGHDEHGDGELERFLLRVTGYDGQIVEIHLGDENEEEEHHDDENEEEEHQDDENEEEEHHDDENEEEEHQDDDSDRFTFEVVGVKAGTTELTLQLMHGDHPDFTALPLPVTVQ